MIIPAYKYINAYTRLCIIISSVLFFGIWCLISGLLLIFNNGWNSCGKSYKDEAGATKQTTHPNKHHGKSIVNKVPIRDLTITVGPAPTVSPRLQSRLPEGRKNTTDFPLGRHNGPMAPSWGPNPSIVPSQI